MFVICHVLILMKTEVTTPILPKSHWDPSHDCLSWWMICPTVSPRPPRSNSVKSQHVLYLSGKKSDSTLWLSFPFFFFQKCSYNSDLAETYRADFIIIIFFNQLKEHKISTFLNTTLNTGFSFENGVLTQHFCDGLSWNDAKEHNNISLQNVIVFSCFFHFLNSGVAAAMSPLKGWDHCTLIKGTERTQNLNMFDI